MRDRAEELRKLYAARKAVRATPSAQTPNTWQQEFEDAFEYDLDGGPAGRPSPTSSGDMESSTPMRPSALRRRRATGKTEVAMRAAFPKAVMEGKQAAFLAPTTILAFQHQKTLKERFAGFPVRIDMQ